MREEVLYEILLDIHKAYYNLDRGLCIDIIAAYGVYPQALRLLWRYWYQILMVARAGG